MIKIRRGSTTEITVHIPESLDMPSIQNIWLYIAQNIDGCNTKVIIDRSYAKEELDKDDIERIISVVLTQEETLALKVGTAVLQLRLYFDDNTSLPSAEESVRVLDVYKGGVMTSEN